MRNKVYGLHMVNWNGIPYEAFQFGPTMTSLIGHNGAGKTTIMLAWKLVFLPFKDVMDFSNQAEGEADRESNKYGLFGRLGVGKVSYVAAEFVLNSKAGSSDSRLIAGVQIRKKLAPDFELTPFVVRGLPQESDLRDIFFIGNKDTKALGKVVDSDEKRGFRELAANVKDNGGEFEHFDRRLQDYSQYLYENEIIPVNLRDRKLRQQYGHLLNLAMKGGLSKSMSQKIKDYILSGDSSLTHYISDAEKRLGLCRATQREIERNEKTCEFLSDLYRNIDELMVSSYGQVHLKMDETLAEYRQFKARKQKVMVSRKQLLQSQKAADLELNHLEHEYSEHSKVLDNLRVDVERIQQANGIKKNRDKTKKELKKLEDDDLKIREKSVPIKVELVRLEEERKVVNQNLQDCIAQLQSDESPFEIEEKKASQYAFALSCIEDLGLVSKNHRPNRSSIEKKLREEHGSVEAAYKSALDRLQEQKQKVDASELLMANKKKIAMQVLEIADILAESGFEFAAKLRNKTLGVQVKELGKLIESVTKSHHELPILNIEEEKLKHEVESRARIVEVLKVGKSWYGEVESHLEYIDLLGEEKKRLEKLSIKSQEINKEIQSTILRKEELNHKIDGLNLDVVRFAKFQELISRLDRIGCHIRTIDLETVQSTKAQTEEQIFLIRREIDLTAEKIGKLEKKIQALKNKPTHINPKLQDICDKIEGQLLSELLENDINLEEAASKQAILGPLATSILVSDKKAAYRKLKNLIDSEDLSFDIYLVEKNVEELLDLAEPFGDHAIIVKSPEFDRITRFPDVPSLGKKARESIARGLEKEKSASEEKLETLKRQSDELALTKLIIDQLVTHSDCFTMTDPIELLEELNRQVDRESSRLNSLNKAYHSQLSEHESRLKQYQKLLAVEHLSELLDKKDLFDKLEAVTQLKLLAKKNTEVFSRIQTKSQILSQFKNNPGLDVEDLNDLKGLFESMQKHAQEHGQRLQAFNRALEAVRYLDYYQSFKSMRGGGKKTKVESLKLQINELNDQQKKIEDDLSCSLSSYKELESELSKIELKKAHLNELCREYENELEELGVGSRDFDDTEINRKMKKHKGMLAKINKQREEKIESKGQLKGQVESINKELDRISGEFSSFYHEVAKPTFKSMRHLKKNLFQRKLYQRAKSKENPDGLRKRSLAALTNIQSMVKEKLAHFGGGATPELKGFLNLSQQLEKLKSADEIDSISIINEFYRHTEEIIRDSLSQYAELDFEPMEAIKLFSESIERLRIQLNGHEKQFAARTEDIHNAISVRIAGEKRRIQNLNRQLGDVHFGLIRGVRIHFDRVDQWDKILTALSDGAGNGLFQSENQLSYADALALVYDKVIGGQIKGEMLLDYRSYVDLSIEVRRDGKDRWEKANVNQLSTGESIGVGFAVLLMVTSSWERSMDSLREGSDESKSFARMLCLDEVSRLDSEAMNTLASFCENQQLQLLIAAPQDQMAPIGVVYKLRRVGKEVFVGRLNQQNDGMFDEMQERIVSVGIQGLLPEESFGKSTKQSMHG